MGGTYLWGWDADNNVWRKVKVNAEGELILSADLTVEDTEVFSGTSPVVWTDLDLSGTIGANAALVLLKFKNATLALGFVAVRRNGDTDEYYSGVDHPGGTVMGHSIVGYVTVLLVHTDSAGIIEWKTANARAGTTVTLMAYIK